MAEEPITEEVPAELSPEENLPDLSQLAEQTPPEPSPEPSPEPTEPPAAETFTLDGRQLTAEEIRGLQSQAEEARRARELFNDPILGPRIREALNQADRQPQAPPPSQFEPEVAEEIARISQAQTQAVLGQLLPQMQAQFMAQAQAQATSTSLREQWLADVEARYGQLSPDQRNKVLALSAATPGGAEFYTDVLDDRGHWIKEKGNPLDALVFRIAPDRVLSSVSQAAAKGAKAAAKRAQTASTAKGAAPAAPPPPSPPKAGQSRKAVNARVEAEIAAALDAMNQGQEPGGI